jgi:polyisoprenoid-binding protein YceI
MSTLATLEISTTTWKIDPVHSVAEFKVKHMMIANVKGQFTGVSGALSLDERTSTAPTWRLQSTPPPSTPARPIAIRI